MCEKAREIFPITGWRVNPKNGLISCLHTKNRDFVISTAGCEIGNWLGFFSQDELAGVKCSINNRSIVVEEEKLVSRFDISLPHARFALELKDSIEEGYWCRHYLATAIESSWLGDFVIRLGVSSKVWQTAGNGSRYSHHRGWNRYLQYPVKDVVLKGGGMVLQAEIESSADLNRMATLSYWRDDPSTSWIVHHRHLVKSNDWDYIIGRFRNATRTSFESSWLSSPFVWRPLWAFNERWISRLPYIRLPAFQTQGVIEMKKGQKLSMKTRVGLSLDTAVKSSILE